MNYVDTAWYHPFGTTSYKGKKMKISDKMRFFLLSIATIPASMMIDQIATVHAASGADLLIMPLTNGDEITTKLDSNKTSAETLVDLSRNLFSLRRATGPQVVRVGELEAGSADIKERKLLAYIIISLGIFGNIAVNTHLLEGTDIWVGELCSVIRIRLLLDIRHELEEWISQMRAEIGGQIPVRIALRAMADQTPYLLAEWVTNNTINGYIEALMWANETNRIAMDFRSGNLNYKPQLVIISTMLYRAMEEGFTYITADGVEERRLKDVGREKMQEYASVFTILAQGALGNTFNNEVFVQQFCGVEDILAPVLTSVEQERKPDKHALEKIMVAQAAAKGKPTTLTELKEKVRKKTEKYPEKRQLVMHVTGTANGLVDEFELRHAGMWQEIMGIRNEKTQVVVNAVVEIMEQRRQNPLSLTELANLRNRIRAELMELVYRATGKSREWLNADMFDSVVNQALHEIITRTLMYGDIVLLALLNRDIAPISPTRMCIQLCVRITPERPNASMFNSPVGVNPDIRRIITEALEDCGQNADMFDPLAGVNQDFREIIARIPDDCGRVTLANLKKDVDSTFLLDT
ncbi:MAG: hypothetical protein LBT03_02310 [Holosporales bacterium]|nr:hypothetical protein [Holosporales bacterium]